MKKSEIINGIKILVSTIDTNHVYDEFDANIKLSMIREHLLQLVKEELPCQTAVVLTDIGDYGYQLLELEVDFGVQPEELVDHLNARYYGPGKFGPESILLSLRTWKADGTVKELPFGHDRKPAHHAVTHLIKTAKPIGTTVFDPEDVYSGYGYRTRQWCFEEEEQD